MTPCINIINLSTHQVSAIVLHGETNSEYTIESVQNCVESIRQAFPGINIVYIPNDMFSQIDIVENGAY